MASRPSIERRTRLAPLALAAALLAAAPAGAVVIDAGSTQTVTELGVSYELLSAEFAQSEVFFDLYSFEVAAGALAANGGVGKIRIFTENIGNFLGGGGGPLLTGPSGVLREVRSPFPFPAFDPDPGAPNATVTFNIAIFEPGLYTVSLNGVSLAGPLFGQYSGAISILTPLPIPALLFGAGMVGLAAVRRVRA